MTDLMTEFEELLKRPSLKERAKIAKEEADDERRQRIEAEGIDLMAEACEYMLTVLQMTEGEVADVEISTGTYNPERAVAWWAIDSVKFRVRYKLEKVAEIKADMLDTKEPIYELVPVFEADISRCWKECPTLKRLGELLS